jgi:hypothetical protein
MNYTKGEWIQVDGNFVYCLNKIGTNRFQALISAGQDDNEKRIDKTEIMANTFLISASPDMYEALKAIKNLCDGYTELDKETTSLYIGKILAKAEGK